MKARHTVPRHLLAPAALAAGLLTIAACSINPATGKRQLTLIGEGQEIELGRQADGEISASLGLYPDDELTRYVDGLGRRLAAVSERPDLPWTFRVLDDPVVNAFALPGGYIYVTRGILAHLDTEAELAGVLGHEIGHVTGRHSVEQMSKAQLAQIGLGVGMATSSELRRFADLAQTGLGVLFLKFGRDDERQADDLGVRYAQRAGYDPREMVGVFETLDRVSRAQGEGDRLPGWLSTHPTPENRVSRTSERLGGVAVGPDAVVGRERYLAHLDGLVFGDNPREGFFRGGTFYHPDLAFRLRFPDGWKTRNQRQAVGAVSPGQDAAVVLTLAQASSAEQAARDFFARDGIARGSALRLPPGAPRGVANHFYATSQGGNLEGTAVFVEHEGRVFRLLGYCRQERYGTYGRELEGAVGSFRRVTDRRVLEVEPRRLDIAEVTRTTTLAELARETGSSADTETLARINQIDSPHTPLAVGTLVKLVVGSAPQ